MCPCSVPTVCSARQEIRVPENNAEGAVIETIRVEAGVTLALTPEGFPFRLEGNQLIVTERLDYEVL